MIDTDKYEGHTEGPWVIRTEKVAGQTRMMSFFIRHYTNTESGISKLICSMQGIHEHNADAELIADAPLLLEEVKRLREQYTELREALVGDSPNYTHEELIEKALELTDDTDWEFGECIR